MRTAAFVAKLSEWTKWFFDAENKFIMLWENERRPLFVVFNCTNTKIKLSLFEMPDGQMHPMNFSGSCAVCVRCRRRPWWNWPTTKNTNNSNHSLTHIALIPFFSIYATTTTMVNKRLELHAAENSLYNSESSGCVCVLCNAVHEWEFHEDVSIVMFI